MKSIIIIFIFVSSLLAQEYTAVKVKGDVKHRSTTEELWKEMKAGVILTSNEFVSTGNNSSLQIKSNEKIINLGETSALSLSSIKEMSTDELLLAIALDDMINAPRSNPKNNSGHTATYGEDEGTGKSPEIKTDDFGIKRLNGAVELAKNDYKESSVIFAKETYRKYPDSKQLASYRIFFADILLEKGLYEEALGEYLEIEELKLSKEEKEKVEFQIKGINKILLNN